MTEDKTNLTHRTTESSTVVAISEQPNKPIERAEDRFGPYVRLMFVMSLILLATDAVTFVTVAITFPGMTPTSYLAITVFSITFVLMLAFANSAYWRSRSKQQRPDEPEGIPNEIFTNIFTHLAAIYSGVVLSLIVAAEISMRK